MNFEGRYLIRWGIPGWIFLISLFIYFLLIKSKEILLLLENSAEILATTVILTVLGIPVGYLLNQIHHVWIWVIRVNWTEYFEYELILMRNYHGQEQRYKYLLTRVHELGGILIAFVIINIINFFTIFYLVCVKSYEKAFYMFLYFLIILILNIVIWISRNYFQRNLDALTYFLSQYDYQKVKSWLWFIRK